MVNYVIENVDELIGFLQELKERYPDRVFVSGVPGKISFNAPNKRQKNYTAKIEHTFHPTCFVGNGVTALMDGGGFYLAHVPREHISPDLLAAPSDTVSE